METPNEDAKTKRERRLMIREAEQAIEDMTKKQLQEACKGFGLPVSNNEDLMVNALIDFAEVPLPKLR